MTVLVNEGLERKARRMFADTYSPFQYLALGRSDMAEAIENSTLGDEITGDGGARMIADTMEYEAVYKAKWIGEWTFSDTLAIFETAIFDNSTLKIVEDCEDAWNEYTAVGVTSTADADHKVGTLSAKLTVADAVGADTLLATEVIAADLTSYEYVNMWVKSSVALDLGDMQLLLDDHAQCASPTKSLDIPALGAGTWTLVQLDLGDASGLGALISIGIKQIVDKGAFNLYIDHVHCPGTMLMRHKFALVKNVGNGDTLTLTFRETESRP